jgi:hypothetical protein
MLNNAYLEPTPEPVAITPPWKHPAPPPPRTYSAPRVGAYAAAHDIMIS